MSSLSKSFHLSSSLREEVMVTRTQGIVSVLGSDSERTKTASLRRTLSADMSSKRWQARNGFYPLKKNASSEGFPVSITDSSSGGEEEYETIPKEVESPEQDDIWSSIQEDKKKKAVEQPGQFDLWSSIISQKAQEDTKNIPPPYIHPLVKRSASSLSGKSLEICTESLGSETGSDGFSSYPPSEADDPEEDKEEQEQEAAQIQQQEAAHNQQQEAKAAQNNDVDECYLAKYNLAAAASREKSPQRSLPPPIPSLSSRHGATLHMRSHRNNGRLVLEAVSVPPQNKFCAQRQDGRLVLTFIKSPDEEEQKKEDTNDGEQFEVELENSDYEKEYDDEAEMEEEEEEEDEREEEEMKVEIGDKTRGGGGIEEVRFVMEQAPKLYSGVMIHRLAIRMSKSTLLTNNRNSAWTSKFNKKDKFKEDGEEEVVASITTVTQSLPPRASVARMIPPPQPPPPAVTAKAAASFNACEYFWKPKPTSATSSVLNPITKIPAPIRSSNNQFILSRNIVSNEQQELQASSGSKGDFLVPSAKGCKEPRRPLPFWDTPCIATS